MGKVRGAERSIAVLRRPDGLFAKVNRVRENRESRENQEQPEDPTARSRRRSERRESTAFPATDRRLRFETVTLRLEDVSLAVCPNASELLAAWASLERARWDECTLVDVLRLAATTVAGAQKPTSLPDLPSSSVRAASEPRRATAAHPRAYRGTTFKPGKLKKPPVTDLRPYIADRRGLRMVLECLEPHWLRALPLLGSLGVCGLRIRSSPASDPYVAAQFPDAPEKARFPSLFQVEFLPLLRTMPWSVVERFLASWFALDLETEFELRAAIVRLVLESEVAVALAWCHLVEQQPVSIRAMFVSYLIERGPLQRAPDGSFAGALDRLRDITPSEWIEARLAAFFDGLSNGAPVDYLLEGFELAQRHCASYVFRSRAPKGAFSTTAFRSLIQHLEAGLSADALSYFPLSLWARFAEFEGFDEVVGGNDWRSLSPRDAVRLFEGLGCVHYDEGDLTADALSAKWRFVRGLIPQILERLGRVRVDFRGKFIGYVFDFIRFWKVSAEVDAWMNAAYAISERLAAPPFSTEREGSDCIRWLIEGLPPEPRSLALAAPDGAFIAIEKEDSPHVSRGLSILVSGAPALAIDALYAFPRKLLKVARLFGSLSAPVGRRVLEDFRHHPLAQPAVLGLPPYEQLMSLTANARGLSNPMSKRLQAHAVGKRCLTRVQLERDQKLFAERIALTRLEVLETQLVDRLTTTTGLPLDARRKSVRHALFLLHSSEENRRGFKKMLLALAEGRSNYVLRHARSQAWLAKHPEIDVEVWLRGITAVVDLPARGTIRIALERDPFEAMQLGTYVGSCLALDGLCAYSAAAVVLDINKQVFYARDSAGRVLARQLVAVTDDGELACFSVYPGSCPVVLSEAFRELDVRFAEALGIRIAACAEEDSIEVVLAQSWWNDGIWEVFADVHQG